VTRRPGIELPPRPADDPVDDELVDFAIELIDRPEVAGAAEAALIKHRGRPRSVSITAVLTGLLVLAITDQPLYLTEITTLLYQRISQARRDRLGVKRRPPAGHRQFQARYRCVRYTFHLLADSMDPSPLPKNRRLAADQLKAATRAMTTAQATTARDRLETFVNALLEASLSVLFDNEYDAWDGSLGLDATCVPLFSQGPSKRSGLCASDPDGGWYVREGDHRDREDHTGKGRTRIAWALEATIATMARPPGQTTGSPNLAVGLVLDRPGIDPGGTGARVLASIRRRGHQPGWLGADRAYTNAMPNTFHLPAAALGYSLVADYRADSLGVQANTGGAILLEGTWSCPATPEALINATTDHRDKLIDNQLYADRIAARGDYHLKPKDGPDADGYIRLSCPAQGDHARLACPLRENSPAADGRTPVLDPPEQPPKICTQTAITIAPDIGARHRQDLQFGTEQWQRRYATLRNTIEGLNGYAKDPAHQALAAPGRRRVRGTAAQTIFVAILLMATNLRKIRTHRAIITDNQTDPLTRRARRRRTSLTQHLPDG
jgi:hypothetical protein